MIKRSSLLLSFLLAGCSTHVAPSAALLESQKAYETSRDNVTLKRYASVSLFQAGKLYTLSKSAKDTQEANHLGYLLKQELEVAQELVKTKMLEEKMLRLGEVKTLSRLKKKEQEVLRAQAEARAAKEAARIVMEEKRQMQEKFEELQELNAQMTNRGLVLTLGDVLFASNEARLMAGAARAMDKLVQFLQENPTRMVLIEGHTDNVGNTTYNIDLSLRRAEAVGQSLVYGGIDAGRIVTKGYGEAYPVAENTTAEGKQQNRRVEIVILREGEGIESVVR